MGAAASLQAELTKPLDASDLDGRASVAEVSRLRTLLQNEPNEPPPPAENIPTVTFSSEILRKSASSGKLTKAKSHVAAAAKLADKDKLNEVNEDLETALHLAAAGGHAAIAQLLIDAGASLDLKDDSGFSALRHCAGASKVNMKPGHLECAKLLCAAKADCNVVCDYGWTPLMKACEMGHTSLCEIFLNDSNVELNKLENGGESALDKAEGKEHVELIAMLKEKGATSGSSGGEE